MCALAAQAKLQYFTDLEHKQKGLLGAEVSGSTKLQEHYQQQEQHFKRRADDARRTIEVARSAITQKDMTGHSRAVHVLEQGLCSNPNCKVADTRLGGPKKFAMFGRTGCKCGGSWMPETGHWDDQVWTNENGKPTGYYSYTYKESEIDRGLDIYWVRVLAERIKAKIQRGRAGVQQPLTVLDLPKSWPHTIPEEELGTYLRSRRARLYAVDSLLRNGCSQAVLCTGPSDFIGHRTAKQLYGDDPLSNTDGGNFTRHFVPGVAITDTWLNN
eukprot:COSAG02_NODE_10859_length_1845_cov_1.172394_2_plen_271_part_00